MTKEERAELWTIINEGEVWEHPIDSMIDDILASKWLAAELNRAREEGRRQAVEAVMRSPHAWLDGARGTCITKLDARAAIEAIEESDRT